MVNQVHSLSVEMLRESVVSQLAAGVENRVKRDELEVAKLLLEKQVVRKEVELEERAGRERKLQAEVAPSRLTLTLNLTRILTLTLTLTLTLALALALTLTRSSCSTPTASPT